MSFRNRCRIAGAGGVIDLSIPLVGGRDQKTLIKEVRIEEGRGWRDRHWRTILFCYSRSPWFDHYCEGLEALYRRPANFLLDWDLLCFEWVMKALGMERPVRLTETYKKVYTPGEGEDWRGRIMPGSAATDLPRYRQVFEERTGFIRDLSILDLLFCEGKNAIRYIQS